MKTKVKFHPYGEKDAGFYEELKSQELTIIQFGPSGTEAERDAYENLQLQRPENLGLPLIGERHHPRGDCCQREEYAALFRSQDLKRAPYAERLRALQKMENLPISHKPARLIVINSSGKKVESLEVILE